MNIPEMPGLGGVKKKAADVGKMQICTSVDLGMKLCRRGGTAVKSVSFHHGCKIGLVKAVLVMLGVMLVVVGFFSMRRAVKKRSEE